MVVQTVKSVIYMSIRILVLTVFKAITFSTPEKAPNSRENNIAIGGLY